MNKRQATFISLLQRRKESSEKEAATAVAAMQEEVRYSLYHEIKSVIRAHAVLNYRTLVHRSAIFAATADSETRVEDALASIDRNARQYIEHGLRVEASTCPYSNLIDREHGELWFNSWANTERFGGSDREEFIEAFSD